MFEWLDRMGSKAFKKLKWALTAMSGALTTGLIVSLES